MYLLWMTFCSLIFARFAYEIDQLGARLRTLLIHGKTSLREFEDYIPASFPPSGRKVVSPFYVVHYGIYFSETLRPTEGIWSKQSTMNLWNVKPSGDQWAEREKYFKAAAEWVLKNGVYLSGQAHLPYEFDWAYKNYPGGMLKATWWSGLTDGYAIVLMLRAYEYFGSPAYLEMATKLYESVTTPIEAGGSLRNFRGCPWVEEYVDPRIEPQKMSAVLNGAVYAAIGVEYYEQFTGEKDIAALSKKLFDCVVENLNSFSMGWWSYYDAIGSSANIKYHRINYALVLEVLDRSPKVERINHEDLIQRWGFASRHPGLFYVIYGPRSFSYYQFLFFFLISLLAPVILITFRKYMISRSQKTYAA